jgi:hypothetical protein
MYISSHYTNFTIIDAKNDSKPIVFLHSSSSGHSGSILLIFILSILCFLGVIFMVFGPMMRSEAWKRVDNYIFGRNSVNEHRVVDGEEHGDD